MVCSQCSGKQSGTVVLGVTYICTKCSYRITPVSVVEKRELPINEDLVDFVTKVKNGEIEAEHIEMTELPSLW